MPTDFSATVYAAVYGRIAAGVTAYNAAIDATVLTGCKKVALLQKLDDRVDGRVRSMLTAGPPGAYPMIRLKITGGDEQKTSTPTFGLMSGAACDAIVPKRVQLVEEITFDPGVPGDAAETPLEAYIDAAFHAAGFYPKLGITYCRGFTFTNITRRPEKVNGVMCVVRRKTISVDLRPHLADVQ